MQRAVTAQISSRGPVAPAPLSTRRGMQPAGPAWRISAASLFSPEASGPFSFWPRGAEAVRKAAAAAPQMGKRRDDKAAPPAVSMSESSLDIEPEFTMGKQRFRSALEQVRTRSSVAQRACAAAGSAWLAAAAGAGAEPTRRRLPFGCGCLPPPILGPTLMRMLHAPSFTPTGVLLHQRDAAAPRQLRRRLASTHACAGDGPAWSLLATAGRRRRHARGAGAPRCRRPTRGGLHNFCLHPCIHPSTAQHIAQHHTQPAGGGTTLPPRCEGPQSAPARTITHSLEPLPSASLPRR